MEQMHTRSQSQSSVDRKDGRREITRPEEILALLASKQFDIVYNTPYRGDDQKIMSLLHQSEELCASLAVAAMSPSLISAVGVIDACLIPALPAPEVKNLITTIVKKDPSLIPYMPHTRKMMSNVFRAVELSSILNPSVLARIAADVASQEPWRGVIHG
jgi:hypothetical protein